MKPMRNQKFKAVLQEYRSSLAQKNDDEVILHLGRAHVLSQSSTTKHLYVHWLMFLFSVSRLDGKETLGQVLRLIVTVPGHLIGKVPVGNIGWSTVGLTQTMPIPDDLKSFVD